jgi:6-bladed beta-propeller protein
MKNIWRIIPGLLLAGALLAPRVVVGQQKVTLPARDMPLPEKPSQIYSVGAEDGESWELLSGVRAVAFDARDNLYILDGNNYRILVFDANGRYLRQISKQGGGPGELMAPIGMTVTNDGLIVVGDAGRRAYSLFKPDGTFMKNVLFEEGELPGLSVGGIKPHPRSGVVSRTATFLVDAPGRDGRGRGAVDAQRIGGPTGERKSYVKWYDFGSGSARSSRGADGARAGGDVAKTARLFEFTLPSITPRVVDSGAGRGERRVAMSVTTPMWQPQPTFGVLPTGGVAFAHEKEYRVKVANPMGKVERIIERPIAPKKATDKDRQLAITQQRENLKRGGGTRLAIRVGDGGGTRVSTGGPPAGEEPSIEEMLKNTTFEEYIPVLRRVDTDPQGRIWIARTPADFGQRGPVDLLRVNGAYIGTVANDRIPDAVSRSGRAAYIERDDLGVERVAVKRVPTTWQ